MKSKFIFFFLVATLIISTVWWIWVDVLVNGGKIREKESELLELENKFDKLEKINKSYSTVQEQYRKELESIDSLKREIPDRDSFIEVFKEIRRIAEKQNINIKSLSPNMEDSFPGIKQKLKFTKKHIERYRVQLQIQGEFLTIGIFLEELISLPTIVNIARISLDTELDVEGVLACELVLYTYILFDEEGTA